MGPRVKEIHLKNKDKFYCDKINKFLSQVLSMIFYTIS